MKSTTRSAILVSVIGMAGCVMLAVKSAGIFDYGAVEFVWLKNLAIGGWLTAASLFLVGVLWLVGRRGGEGEKP